MTCEFSSKARNRIIIQKPTETVDSYGGRTTSFTTHSTVWAQITPTSGRELFAQGAVQSRLSHKILIRYQASLKDVKASSDFRISYDGRLFGVQGIRNLDTDMKTEGRFFQELLCEENGADING
jgi:SPP1 family predicted phage head-tail adaptor